MQSPQRLASGEFMGREGSVQIFRTTLHEPYPLHWHEFFELTFVLSGRGRHIVNGVEYALKPCCQFLLSPADFHTLIPLPGETLEVYNLIFASELLDGELRHSLLRDRGTPQIMVPMERVALIESAYQRIWDELHTFQFGYQRMTHAAIDVLLIEYARQRLLEPGPVAHLVDPRLDQHPAIRQALLYIEHHFRSPLTLEHIARQFGLAPNYFSECFHKTVGVTYQGYLQGLRLRFAASLLAVSDLPVSEICIASGFSTISHFGRAFKQHFGLAPSAYRQHAPGAPTSLEA